MFLAIIFYLEISVTIPSPIAFGDEAYYTQLSRLVARNVQYYTWMPFEGDSVEHQGFFKPPMWIFLEGSFYYLFGFSPLIVEILTPLISVLTGLAAYAMFGKIFNKLTGFLSSIILVTVPSIVTYADLFYVDTLLIFWITLFVGTFILYEKTKDKKYLVLSTAFAALSILTKAPAYLILPFYFLYFLYEFFKIKDFRVIKKYIFIVVVLLVFLGGFFLRNLYYFNAPICAGQLEFLFRNQNCIVTSNYTPQNNFAGRTALVGTEQNVYSLGLISFFQFAYGQIWLVPLLFTIGAVLILARREKFGLISLLYLLATLPIFYLTYSGRAEDAARYTLIAVPAISVVASIYLEELSRAIKRYSKYLPVLLILVVIVASFSNFYSKNAIMSGVKQFSPLFLQACDWVKQNTPTNSTLLSENGHPTVYNCDRNAVWELQDLPDIILSNNVTLVKDRLSIDGINYIFVQKFAISPQAYEQSYPISFIQFLEQNNNTFQKVYENGPDLNTCLSQGGCDGSIIYKVL